MVQKKKSVLALLLVAAIFVCFSAEPVAAAETQSVYGVVETENRTLTLENGDWGTLQGPEDVDYEGAYFSMSYSWPTVLDLDSETGEYDAISSGSAIVYASFYDEGGNLVASIRYQITVVDDSDDSVEPADMTGVTLDKTSVTQYVEQDSYYSVEFEFNLVAASGSTLPYDPDAYKMDCTSSNSDIEVDGYLSYGGRITLYTYGKGTTTVTLTINGKIFTVTLRIVEVGINKGTLLLTAKKTAQLKTTGIKTGVKWSSTNSKVVSVNSSGKITAKKNGNAVIKAVIKSDQGEFTMGCAVSVVSQKKYKAVKKAIRIAETSTYSQAKRMQNGYYDCSSLVWRAYKYAGVTLGGVSGYAPVAANLGKWFVQKKKTIKGGLKDSNVQAMKLQAGDLMFETGSSNGRYKGIYHVEMITGYYCEGFDSNGKPILGLTWASRPDGAYGHVSSFIVGRP